MEQTLNLKLCPFCGNEVHLYTWTFPDDEGNQQKAARVECKKCSFYFYGSIKSAEGAIQAWNQRPLENKLISGIRHLARELRLTLECNRFIPVTEHVSRDQVWVQVWVDGSMFPDIGYYDGVLQNWPIGEVTHWREMPLAPPSEAEKHSLNGETLKWLEEFAPEEKNETKF